MLYNVGKLTKQELEVLLHRVCNVTMSGSKSKLGKADYVKALEKEHGKNFGKFEAFVDTLGLGNATTECLDNELNCEAFEGYLGSHQG